MVDLERLRLSRSLRKVGNAGRALGLGRNPKILSNKYSNQILARAYAKLLAARTRLEPVHVPVLVIPGETLDKVNSSAQCFVAKSLSRDVDFL
jgi:hypothetical protein